MTLLFLPLGPLPSLADTPFEKPPSFADLYPPMPGVEYFCTDSIGARMELGQVICVEASCQTWMARCEKSNSNGTAMWRKIQDGCPAVAAGKGLRSRLERAGLGSLTKS